MSNWIWTAAETTLSFLRPSQPLQPQRNLQHYAQQAILPEMLLPPEAPAPPPPGSKSHKNKLAVQHELFRNLECMQPIRHFDQLSIEFTQLNMPNTTVHESDNDDIEITVPALGYEIVPRVLRRPVDLNRLFRWVVDYPLQTVSRIMHLVYPETKRKSYGILDDDSTFSRHSKDLIRWVKWAPDHAALMDASDLQKPTLIVFVQPPWILSHRDLEVFASRRTFPSPHEHWNRPLTSSERLWAKAWDVCAHNRSHFFVVTSYWGWVFGAFSEERTQAWTSDVIHWNSENPTVIQYLFFWFACATVQEQTVFGAWTIPEVPEPVDAYDEDYEEPEEDSLMDIAPSESDEWEARSDARSHTPSANLTDDDEGTVIFETTGQGQHRRRVLLRPDPDAIMRWQSKTGRPIGPYNLGGQQDSESDITTSSATTDTSVSTVRDYSHNNRHVGSWLSGRPMEFRAE